MDKKKENPPLTPRPPVVVIMGHIDHGKTTLLDHIRSANVAAKESGSITQHIGAYEVQHNAERITFLDTPGHESFSRMRARGAQVADIAVVVVAGDDGVKPQTVEAIRAAHSTSTPFLVAITKIDKPEADANRVKGELAEQNVLVEGWGGSVPVAEVSAQMGQGVSELLDLILLTAELEELTASPDNAGNGIVIESHRDRRRGAVATLLIKDGTVRTGDYIASGAETGSVRVMEDGDGAARSEVTFSTPVCMLGFSAPPVVGDGFMTYKTKKEAEAAADAARAHKDQTKAAPEVEGADAAASGGFDGGDRLRLPLVIKADVSGSAEALEGEVSRLSHALLDIRMLRSDVGDVSEDDVKSVSGTNGTIIIGFKVKVTPSAEALAKRYGVTIHTSEIIYELLEWLRAELEKRLPAKTVRTDEGSLNVLKVFKKEGTAAVFGGTVAAGVVRNGSLFEVMRGDDVAGKGVITNLQRNKVDTKEVAAGFECGLAARMEGDLAAGDVVRAYTEETTPAKLDA